MKIYLMFLHFWLINSTLLLSSVNFIGNKCLESDAANFIDDWRIPGCDPGAFYRYRATKHYYCGVKIPLKFARLYINLVLYLIFLNDKWCQLVLINLYSCMLPKSQFKYVFNFNDKKWCGFWYYSHLGNNIFTNITHI